MIPSKEQIFKWRKDFDTRSFTSAIDDYCPDEFGNLLDAVDLLQEQNAKLAFSLFKAVKLLCSEYPKEQWAEYGIESMLMAVATAQSCTVDEVLCKVGETPAPPTV